MAKEFVDLKALQERLLVLFREFDAFMQEHDIQYCAAYGTLLGAVRHKGFIPWDDDLDVMITKDQFQKLYSLRHRLPSYLKLQTRETDPGYALDFAKIRDERTRVFEGNGVRADRGQYHGLYIDLFVLSGYTREAEQTITELYDLYALKKKIASVKKGTFKRYFVSPWKRWVRHQIRRKIKGLSRFEVQDITQSYFVSDNWAEPFFWETSRFFPWVRRYSFDDLNLTGPKDFDYCLRTIYGEYMVPPPDNSRGGHMMSFSIFE